MTGAPSRRDVLRGLAMAGLALGAVLPEAAAAKKKKKKRKKPTPRPVCQKDARVATHFVYGDGRTSNTVGLAQGQRYVLRATGFWLSNTADGQDAFANFPLADPSKHVTTYEGTRLGLTVDGGSPDAWGSYTPNHVYQREVIGQGNSLALRCADAGTADNRGVVVVDIFCG